jgi:putative MATE family efflux protein
MSDSTNHALQGAPFQSFLRYAIPSALGLLAMSTASVVDGIFVGRYEGSEALAAINLIIPVFSITFGMAFMMAVGGSVAAGKCVGEKDHRGASNIFSKTLMATLTYAALLLALGLYAAEHLYALLGAGPELFPLMAEYFETLIWFLPAQLLTVTYYFFVRIAGYPSLASAGLIVGAAANLVLDWLLIGVWGLGLRGAAMATGLSSVITILTLLFYLFKPGRWMRFYWRQSRWIELGRACFNGLSEFINEISAGVVTFILNLVIIQRLGVDGVAAFTVVSYSLFIGLLLAFSVADALQAVCSQCFGARNAQRMQQFLAIATTTVIINAVIFIVLLLSQGTQMVSLFVTDGDTRLVSIAEDFIQVLWPVFVFNGLNVVVSAYLTSIHHSVASASVATLRSLALPLLLLAILTQWLPNWPFLLALTGAEALTLLVAAMLFYRFRPQRVLAETL